MFNLFNRPRRIVPNDTPFNRAGGACVCETCHKEYWKHEQVAVEGTWELHPLVLYALCNGKFVKL